jgi:hypothetical protein
LVFLSVLAGCSGAGGSRHGSGGGDSAVPANGRFTLSGTLQSSTGLVLGTGTVVATEQGPGDSDFYLSVRQVIQLRGAATDGAAFCAKGLDFSALSQIPTSIDDCTWTFAEITGNAPYSVSVAAGRGYVVRDRGLSLYRLIIADDRIDQGSLARVTFDVSPVTQGP